MCKILHRLSLIALLGIAARAGCGETSGQLMVSMNVVAACRLSVQTTTLSFGDVAQDAGSATARADLGVRCSSNQPYAIAFDYGRHAEGGQRRMSNGVTEVAYQLYADAAGRQPLGPQGSAGELRGMGDGNEQHLAVYGRLDLDRNTTPGMYTDVVRMTVTW